MHSISGLVPTPATAQWPGKKRQTCCHFSELASSSKYTDVRRREVLSSVAAPMNHSDDLSHSRIARLPSDPFSPSDACSDSSSYSLKSIAFAFVFVQALVVQIDMVRTNRTTRMAPSQARSQRGEQYRPNEDQAGRDTNRGNQHRRSYSRKRRGGGSYRTQAGNHFDRRDFPDYHRHPPQHHHRQDSSARHESIRAPEQYTNEKCERPATQEFADHRRYRHQQPHNDYPNQEPSYPQDRQHVQQEAYYDDAQQPGGYPLPPSFHPLPQHYIPPPNPVPSYPPNHYAQPPTPFPNVPLQQPHEGGAANNHPQFYEYEPVDQPHFHAHQASDAPHPSHLAPNHASHASNIPLNYDPPFASIPPNSTHYSYQDAHIPPTEGAYPSHAQYPPPAPPPFNYNYEAPAESQESYSQYEPQEHLSWKHQNHTEQTWGTPHSSHPPLPTTENCQVPNHHRFQAPPESSAFAHGYNHASTMHPQPTAPTPAAHTGDHFSSYEYNQTQQDQTAPDGMVEPFHDHPSFAQPPPPQTMTQPVHPYPSYPQYPPPRTIMEPVHQYPPFSQPLPPHPMM
ncbi:hypothetical protein PCANC_00656 [Puccinia coronata f. sp. avenae]|uniref:Uncharacterized protein n=2 Tax=Puccinia coronata f. sp. avenae TaxID=200324 RepID=A0A2N5W6V5_9BASI|nr:hypothetical protein PCANC_00656 [Puccinia coronata f. sp. avenae]